MTQPVSLFHTLSIQEFLLVAAINFHMHTTKTIGIPLCLLYNNKNQLNPSAVNFMWFNFHVIVQIDSNKKTLWLVGK